MYQLIQLLAAEGQVAIGMPFEHWGAKERT
jgi:hypothetical protein